MRCFRRIILDAEITGRQYDIVLIEKSFGIVNNMSLSFFMEDDMVFAMDYLLLEMKDTTLNKFEWKLQDIKFLIQGYHYRVLNKIPLDRLRESLIVILREDGDMKYLIPTIDLMLKRINIKYRKNKKRKGSKIGGLKRVVNNKNRKYAYLINLIDKCEILELEKFFNGNNEYLSNMILLKWIIKRERWMTLDFFIEENKNKGIVLEEFIESCLINCEKRYILERFIKAGFRFKINSHITRQDIVNITFSTENKHIINGELVKYAYENMIWKAIEIIAERQERLAEHEEFDKYILDLNEDIELRKGYIDEVCKYGNLERVKKIINEENRPSSQGAANSLLNKDTRIIDYLLTLGIRPTSESLEKTCIDADTNKVKWIHEMKVYPDLNYAGWIINITDKNVMDYLFNNKLINKFIYFEWICANENVETIKELVEEKGLRPGIKTRYCMQTWKY
jgi:hypothetical protein